MKTSLCSLIGLALTAGVYAEDTKPQDLKSLTTDVMLRGYCYAGSREDTEAPGGFGSCDNFPKKLDEKAGTKQRGKDGEISCALTLPATR